MVDDLHAREASSRSNWQSGGHQRRLDYNANPQRNITVPLCMRTKYEHQACEDHRLDQSEHIRTEASVG